MYSKFDMNIVFEGYVSCLINNIWFRMWLTSLELPPVYGATVLDVLWTTDWWRVSDGLTVACIINIFFCFIFFVNC